MKIARESRGCHGKKPTLSGKLAARVIHALEDSASDTFWVRKAPMTLSSTELLHWPGTLLRSPRTTLHAINSSRQDLLYIGDVTDCKETVPKLTGRCQARRHAYLVAWRNMDTCICHFKASSAPYTIMVRLPFFRIRARRAVHDNIILQHTAV